MVPSLLAFLVWLSSLLSSRTEKAKINKKTKWYEWFPLPFLFVLTVPCGAIAAIPSTPLSSAYITDGDVYAIAPPSKGITYIGGNFTWVGPYTGGSASIDTMTGSTVAIPNVNGTVYATVSDRMGGWYVAGTFTKVGAITRNNIAHILSDGSVDPNWNPNINYGTAPITAVKVYALALSSDGNTVYVGGNFNNIGGQPRNYIAALNATTGQATSWNPNASTSVWSLAMSPDGTTLYVGGDFTNIGGQTRNYIAALDVNTGQATSWNPVATGTVKSIAVKSDGTIVYVGGSFLSIGGQTRGRIAAVNADPANPTYAYGQVTDWNPASGNEVYTIALSPDGNTVYVGGWFVWIGGQNRNYIAALGADRANPLTYGKVTPWNPNANNTVRTLVVSNDGSTIYVGGDFNNTNSIGGQDRSRIAALNASDGKATTSWDPSASGTVWSLAVGSDGNTIYAGGQFAGIGGKIRNKIAAVDATTGQVTAWNPNANSYVKSLAVSPDGNTVYAGGNFGTIGGQTRAYIAALNASNGQATSWNPNAVSGSVLSLAVSPNGNTVYAGGNFGAIGGQTRAYTAALNASNGQVTAWNPNPNATVRTLALSGDGSTVYAGGGLHYYSWAAPESYRGVGC